MAANDLHGYVKQALDAGASAEEIKKRLLNHGWDSEAINSALHSLTNQHSPQPDYLGPNDPVPVKYATAVKRLAAFMIDFLILLPINLVVLFVIIAVGRESVPIAVPVQIVVLWFYFAIQESSSAHATLGKKLLGTYTTSSIGTDIDFKQASIRFFAKFASAALLFGGFAYIFFNKKHQALHDIIADTVVPLRENQPQIEQVVLYQRIGLASFGVLIILPIILGSAFFIYEQLKPPVIPSNNSPSAVTSAVAESRDTTRKTDIATYATELGIYFQTNHSYPASAGDSSANSSGIFNSHGPLSSTSTTFPSDPLNGQTRCQLAPISPKKVCAYHYFSDGATYTLWAILELPGSGGGVFFTNSSGSRGLLTAEPSTP